MRPPRIFATRSIARNLTAALLGMILALAAFLFATIYLHGANFFQAGMQERVEHFMSRLSPTLGPLLLNGTPEEIVLACSVLQQNNLVHSFRLENAFDHVLFMQMSPPVDNGRITRRQPITVGDEVVGHAQVVFSLQSVERNTRALMYSTGLLLSAIMLIIMGCTGLLLRVFLRRPLEALRMDMDRIARGDFSDKASPVQHAELAPLSERFSHMASQISQRATELLFANASLQKEVEARKETEKSLQSALDRYTLVMQGSSSGIWDWDLRAGTIYFSSRWKQILGYENDELPDSLTVLHSRVAPEDKERVLQAFADYQERRSNECRIEYRLRHKNGSYRWIHTRGQCLWDDEGRAYRMLGVDMDITDSKNAAMYLQQAKDALANILNAMPSIIMGVDAGFRVTMWNNTAVKQTGKSQHAVMGRDMAQALPEWAFLLRHINKAITEQRVITLNRELLSFPGGVEQHHDVVVYPVTMHGEAGVIVRLDNVSLRVRMEEVMIQTEKVLSIGGLAAGMAHEINNPLGGVLQGAQNIIRRFDPTLPANIVAARELGCDLRAVQAYMEQRGIHRFLEGVREAGARAASIVVTMLEFSRNTAPTRSGVELPHLVRRSLELATNDYDLKKNYDFRQIQVIEQYAPDLPQFICSPMEIEQVLLNLFKNAAQAMPQRGERHDHPCISIRAWREGNTLRFSIGDNGPGIPDELHSRIFEPFYTTKPLGEGTGLGMAVANFIISSRHHGGISLTSKVGVGTTFTITLPLE